MLAMPTIKGAKSPSERFAGANDTHTIEAMMQNGWALQSGTSHFLGQNFARAFDVYYQNASTARELVWATSWGVSTRLIGEFLFFILFSLYLYYYFNYGYYHFFYWCNVVYLFTGLQICFVFIYIAVLILHL